MKVTAAKLAPLMSLIASLPLSACLEPMADRPSLERRAVELREAAWDAWLSASLSAEGLRHKPFTPLPVLGVPGWWAANQKAGFYDDVGVFRPRRVPA